MPNTKENLVELLNDVCAKGFWRYGIDQRTGEEGGHLMTAEDITDYLMENGVTVQKWIPVTERLPERDALVLCIGQRGGMFLGECPSLFSDGSAYFSVPNARRCRFATHWMPLPEPPKGE